MTLVFVFFVLGLWSQSARADVSGGFGLQISFDPIACADAQICESAVARIDFQTDLDLRVKTEGMLFGFHNHAGVTGLEDLILTSSVPLSSFLGGLEIKNAFVFAQAFGKTVAADGQKIPTCYQSSPGSSGCDLLFVRKQVEIKASLFGAATLSNLALLEDVNFPDPDTTIPAVATYSTDDQAFGFGDKITVEGKTPGGILIGAATGLCVEQKENDEKDKIKKHKWTFQVNPDCFSGAVAGTLKPPLAFDFENIWVKNIPLAPHVTGEVGIACLRAQGCEFSNSLAFGSLPFLRSLTAKFVLEDASGGWALTLEKVVAKGSAGPLSFRLTFDESVRLEEALVHARLALAPSASLKVKAKVEPGQGLTELSPTLLVRRSGLAFWAAAQFKDGGGSLNFNKLTAQLSGSPGGVKLGLKTILTPSGLSEVDLSAKIRF